MAKRKILMLTNAELGQANVFLATAHALLDHDPELEIHIASFASLKGTVDDAVAFTQRSNKRVGLSSVIFHSFPGRPQFQCLADEPEQAKNWFVTSRQKPGFWNTPGFLYVLLVGLNLVWSTTEFATIFTKLCELIRDEKPEIVLVDQLFAPGLTAANHMRTSGGQKYPVAVLSPNSLKDWVAHLEPGTAIITKWPVSGSVAKHLPIPWWMVPLNFYFLLRLIFTIVGDKETPAKIDLIRKETNKPGLEVLTNKSIIEGGLKEIDEVLVGSSKEVDYPQLDMTNPPKEYLDKIYGCGPIIRPTAPVSEVDLELAAWLKGGPVVYINLGTHCRATAGEALDMAKVLRQLLDTAGTRTGQSLQLRVLWKLKKDLADGDYNVNPGSPVYATLGPEIKSGRVRIVDWVNAEPAAILQTGDVICSVNHGGANSYYEAVCAGVPQLILPVWVDTYDFAHRVEILGLGRWGSRKGCPRWIVSELAPILVEVALDRNAEFTAKARVLAEICRKGGHGRDVAARKVLKMMES